jgi:hypothetical protein
MMIKPAILGALALALLAGCPKQDHAAGDAAPSASASAAPQATSAAPETTATPSASGTTKPVVKLPAVTIDGGLAVLDAGLALLADAAPLPTPSASGSAQPAAMPPECTAYLAKADACNAKRPAALQGGARAAVAAQKAGWDVLLKQGQAAVVLAQCKGAAAALAADPACK